MKKLILLISIAVFSCSAVYSQSIYAKKQKTIKIFFTPKDIVGKYSKVRGKVISYGVRYELDKGNMLGKVQDKTKATVRLYSSKGIHEGDELYLINSSNLVVAKLKVKTVFQSSSFGKMMVGYGNLRLGSVGDRVVQLSDRSDSQYAYIYKSRGDYYKRTGQDGDAIREYKKAINMDKGNPGARLELGTLYFKQGLYQFALKEFTVGYKNINRLYDNWDKYRLLKGMADIRYKEVFDSYLKKRDRDKYRQDGIRLCNEALQVHPKSLDIHYYLGMFYVKVSHKKSRDHFLKTTEINPDHEKSVKANIMLARLYFAHKNIKKARMFTRKALKADPYNERARNLLKVFKRSERTTIIR